jgi:hypothetical protein
MHFVATEQYLFELSVADGKRGERFVATLRNIPCTAHHQSPILGVNIPPAAMPVVSIAAVQSTAYSPPPRERHAFQAMARTGRKKNDAPRKPLGVRTQMYRESSKS